MPDFIASDLSILLVEPSAMQRKIIRNELNKEQVKNIDEAASITEAVAKLTSFTPDLVVSALHFADGTASDLLTQIRADEALKDLPFMLISSETRHSKLDKIKQSGVVAILPKPFQSQHLTAALNSTIDLLSLDDLELKYYDTAMLRVLLVDDSRLARKAVRKVLENLNVEQITEAENGAEAFALLPQGFDLIITDYNMPEVNGLELTQKIRASSNYSHLPILMITSEANQAHLSNAFNIGVNEMSDKPFEPAKVKELLTKMLEE